MRLAQKELEESGISDEKKLYDMVGMDEERMMEALFGGDGAAARQRRGPGGWSAPPATSLHLPHGPKGRSSPPAPAFAGLVGRYSDTTAMDDPFLPRSILMTYLPHPRLSFLTSWHSALHSSCTARKVPPCLAPVLPLWPC